MQAKCEKGVSVGKGNRGMFIERQRNICAAGIPSSQPNERISDYFQQYSLQDEVDALISDAIVPPPAKIRLPPIRKPPPRDTRNAGIFTETAEIINPPIKTKMQTLVEDFKNTVYASYWKQRVGTIRDPVPNLPEGFKIYENTLGKKIPDADRLYDVIMPKIPIEDKTGPSKQPGYQTNRKYCKPAFNPEKTFGMQSKVDPGGRLMKCCLQDDNVILGKSVADVLESRQADFQEAKKSRVGKCLAPNDNISSVPKGHAFGKISKPDSVVECMTTCKMNPNRQLYLKYLAHLNSLRKCLKKRFDGQFFGNLYRELKYYDKCKTGWLPKDLVYQICGTKYIRFNTALLEPLFYMWNIFNGQDIEYKTFVLVLNHTQGLPNLPKVWDVPEDCLEFRSMYMDTFRADNEVDTRMMAGEPSGRYLDMDYPVTPRGCCKADRFYLPHESDMKSCICPSVFTLLGVSHRDMFAVRSPEVVRKVFEAAGIKKFTDDEFEQVWDEAKKYHSRGLVCFETFKRALEKVT